MAAGQHHRDRLGQAGSGKRCRRSRSESLSGLVQAGFTVVTAVMLARIYAQLAGRHDAQAACPAAGSEARSPSAGSPSRRGSGKRSIARLNGREAGAAIGGERRRMIERAGVDVDAAHAFAPGAAAPPRRAASGRGRCPTAREPGRRRRARTRPAHGSRARACRLRGRCSSVDGESSTFGCWMIAARCASSMTSRENHSQGAPTRRNSSR